MVSKNTIPFCSLFMLSYLVTMFVSGIFVLLLGHNTIYGFFNVFSGGNTLNIFKGFLCTLIGFFGIVCGIGNPNSKYSNSFSKSKIDISSLISQANLITFIFSFMLISIGIYSVYVITAYLGHTNRVIYIDQGFARFYYSTQWLAIGITFLSLYIFNTLRNHRTGVAHIVFVISIFIIFWSVSWTGGRTIPILLALPLIYIFILSALRLIRLL